VLRYTRQLFTNQLKRAFLDELGHGLARETYAQQEFFPFGGGMEPLDRAWDAKAVVGLTSGSVPTTGIEH